MVRSRLNLSGSVVRAAHIYLTSWPLWVLTVLVVVSPLAILALLIPLLFLPMYYLNSVFLVLVAVILCLNLFYITSVQNFTYRRLRGKAKLGDAMADALDQFFSVLMPSLTMFIVGNVMMELLLIFIVLIAISGEGCNLFVLIILTALFLPLSYIYLRVSLYKQFAGIYEEAFFDNFKRSWVAFEGIKGFASVIILALLHAPLIYMMPALLLSRSFVWVGGASFVIILVYIFAFGLMAMAIPMYIYIQIISTIFAASSAEGYDPIKQTFAEPIVSPETNDGHGVAIRHDLPRGPALPSFVAGETESAGLLGKVQSYCISRNAYILEIVPFVIPNAIRISGACIVPACAIVEKGSLAKAEDRFERTGLRKLATDAPWPCLEGDFDYKGTKHKVLLCIVEKGSANHENILSAGARHSKNPDGNWDLMAGFPSSEAESESVTMLATALSNLVLHAPLN